MLFRVLRPLVHAAIRVAFALCGGIRFEGRDNVPVQGGVLIVPNHISDADALAVGVALPRACYFMAKEELFRIPMLGPFIRAMHGFPVKPLSADRQALRTAERLLQQGDAVVLFPEGRVSEDATLQEILPGVLMIASHASAPILPTIIEGTDAVLPYAKVIPRRAARPVRVRFGRPVTSDELTGGQRGSHGLKLGAQRLREVLLALQGSAPVDGQAAVHAETDTGTPAS